MDTEDRKAVYEALGLLEDALADGYRSRRPLPEFAEQFAASEETEQEQRQAKAPAGSPASGVPAPGGPGIPRAAGSIPDNDTLAAVVAEAARCMACRLAAGRARSVPGQGPASPLVMVIGEGPGSEEDRTGIPFVGPAGQLLDRMLASIGLSRESNCFIGNIVKCRPPQNRDPAPDEQAACMPFLDRQIALLRPKAFLAVGRIPAQALLGTKEGIGRLRGRVYDFRGAPLVATYHPSALLRDETLKRPAWEDLKLLKSVIDGLGR